jgi:hypothetical protein
MCKCYTFTVGKENKLQVQLGVSGFNLVIFRCCLNFSKTKCKRILKTIEKLTTYFTSLKPTKDRQCSAHRSNVSFAYPPSLNLD